jgi:hypothetical protein
VDSGLFVRVLNETLSDLKVYARKKYSLTKNVPILVILVTEQEHKILAETYTKLMQANSERSTTTSDGSNEEHSPKISEEFFPNVANIFELAHSYSKETNPIVTPMLRDVFDIPHFGKYKYAIMVREEKLLEWGSQMDIQMDGAQATGKKRKLVIFYRILTQEFLHVVECEKGIQIFESNESTDSEIVQRALKAVKVFRDNDIFSE